MFPHSSFQTAVANPGPRTVSLDLPGLFKHPLKAHLFTLKFRFDEAEKAYETALRYIDHKTNPQLWAETEVDVGVTHAELGIRVEGKAGNEHLAAAITAFRSALEVRTREQLPQQWAMTQTNLGDALREQGSRTGGKEGTELLGQAVTAFRSALEIYTAEAFPFYHERAQEQLKECERLFTQAKPEAQ